MEVIKIFIKYHRLFLAKRCFINRALGVLKLEQHREITHYLGTKVDYSTKKK